MEIMVINWKWAVSKKPEKNIWEEPEHKQKIIICTNYQSNEKKNELDIFKKFLQRVKKDNPKCKILILTHNNKPNYISIGNLKASIKGVNIKKANFKGGKAKIYFNDKEGLLANDTIVNTRDIIAKHGVRNTFDSVWDYYWNNRELEENIKSLVDMCMPLVIDLRTLSEMPEYNKSTVYDNARKKYQNIEILIENQWNSIKYQVKGDCLPIKIIELIKNSSLESFSLAIDSYDAKCLLTWLNNLITKKSGMIVTKET
ncbi:MAG: hypothetical protein P4L35_04405 [Ignavibacteriaceae bacterium]|nr:hypothetical protein [Ignavibacteriaceae bacterium]